MKLVGYLAVYVLADTTIIKPSLLRPMNDRSSTARAVWRADCGPVGILPASTALNYCILLNLAL
ncbi:hypothetical protein J6590_011877 [Homalodisca vitripennis]|nr:hypothetical protein J6590_011877 [Homalodisca vitripennis]